MIFLKITQLYEKLYNMKIKNLYVLMKDKSER